MVSVRARQFIGDRRILQGFVMYHLALIAASTVTPPPCTQLSTGAVMRPIRLARDLAPVNERRSNLADCLNRLEEPGRPIVVTTRRKAAPC